MPELGRCQSSELFMGVAIASNAASAWYMYLRLERETQRAHESAQEAVLSSEDARVTRVRCEVRREARLAVHVELYNWDGTVVEI